MRIKMLTAMLMIAAVAILPFSVNGGFMRSEMSDDMGFQGDGEEGASGMGPHGTRRLREGMAFHYGEGSPSIYIGSEDGKTGLSMEVRSVRFTNDADSMELDMEENGWSLDNEGSDQNIYRYTKRASWRIGSVDSGVESEMEIRYELSEGEGSRIMNYSIKIDEVPGEGDLSISYGFKVDSNENGACCMRTRNRERKGMDIVGEDSSYLGSIEPRMTANVNTSTEPGAIETEVIENVTGDTGVMDVGMSLSGDPQSVETGGYITLLDEFIEAVAGAAEEAVSYVMDHIYSFLIGGGIVIAAILVSVAIFARRDQKRDYSNELNLDESPIYRP